MGVDKLKAIKNKYRISEFNLLMSAVFFGSLGFFLGMRLFRHKTKKTIFILSAPILLTLQSILLLLLLKNNISFEGIINIF